jgi:predicted nucleotidyltransferase
MDLLTREWDLIELPTGEILTTVGSYHGPHARGRLTYVPDEDGQVVIFGRRYRKTRYEIWSAIPGTEQVLGLPGESHYVVAQDHIARHYPAVIPEVLSPDAAPIVEALRAADVEVAVGGSRAMNAGRPGSDYDWVVYGKDAVERAAKVVIALDDYQPHVHFGMDFVHAKYRHFTRLGPNHLDQLVATRWRHFTYRGVPMSIDAADTTIPADPWVNAARELHEPGHVRGVVLDGAQSYLNPRLVDVQTDGGTVQVFTWLNLYAGALRTGDEVEVIGRWATIGGVRFLLVEGSWHAIRIHHRPGSNLV